MIDFAHKNRTSVGSKEYKEKPGRERITKPLIREKRVDSIEVSFVQSSSPLVLY